MPFINTKVNFALTEDNIQNLKSELGRAITIFPGKTERYLMLDFEDDRRMFFGGDDSFRMAMVEVKVFGKLGDCDEMTEVITQLYASELGIEPEHIYVKYEECYHWGMGGTNF